MLVLLPDTIAFVYNFEHVFACLDVEAWELGNGYRMVLSMTNIFRVYHILHCKNDIK